MESKDYLTALASVCDSATRIHIDQQSVPYDASQLPFSADCQVSEDEDFLNTQTLMESCIRLSLDQASSESSCLSLQQTSSSALTAPTPPSSPNYVGSSDSMEACCVSNDLQPYSAIEHYRNPVLRNVIAYARFNQYLEEAWPENSHRRGSAVIRASFYSAIINCLKGYDCGTRFRYWVRKNRFFLIEKPDQGAAGSVVCLGVPTGKSLDKTIPRSYKLVARLEDFVFIIGQYHNEEVGHRGIRKTYAMIQKDFSYLPRTAVSKFVELCDTCASRISKTRLRLSITGNVEATTKERKIALLPQRIPKEVTIKLEESDKDDIPEQNQDTTSLNTLSDGRGIDNTVDSFNRSPVQPITLRVKEQEPVMNLPDVPVEVQIVDTIGSTLIPTESTEAVAEFAAGWNHLESLSWEDLLQLYNETANLIEMPNTTD